MCVKVHVFHCRVWMVNVYVHQDIQVVCVNILRRPSVLNHLVEMAQHVLY